MKKYEQWFPEGTNGISTEEYRDAIIKNIEIVLTRFEEIDFDYNNAQLSDIEKLDEGTYRLRERPTADFLSKTPYFRNGNSEIGILCINNQWLIIIGKEGEHKVVLPEEFRYISRIGYFQIDMHSHPFTSNPALNHPYPSMPDLCCCDSTVDSCQYIVTYKGLIEIQNTSISSIELSDLKKMWDEWTRELPLGEYSGAQLANMFCEQFFNKKIYSWNDNNAINELLSGKEKQIVKKH